MDAGESGDGGGIAWAIPGTSASLFALPRPLP